MRRLGKPAFFAWVMGACLCACQAAPAVPPVLPPTRTSLPTPAPSFTPLPSPASLPVESATPLPSRAYPTPSATLFTPKAPWETEVQYNPWELVTALDWSPDGALLAVAAGNSLFIYDAASMRQLYQLQLSAMAASLAFDPSPEESHRLALASMDGTLQIWDARGGLLLAAWLAHPRGARSAVFSPDGSWLASTGSDAMVRLWQLDELSQLAADASPPSIEMIGGAFAVPDICFSPDGHLVASVDGHSIRLRDPASQRLVNTFRGETSIFSLAFSPQGDLLAAAELGSQVRLWDVAAGQESRLLALPVGLPGDPKQFFWSVAFSPDGSRVAAASSAGVVIVWRVDSGEVLIYWQAHALAATSLAFSPDGRLLASGGLDAALRLWAVP